MIEFFIKHGISDREDLVVSRGGDIENIIVRIVGRPSRADRKGGRVAPMVVGTDTPRAVDVFSAGLLAMRPDVTIRVARTIFESDFRELLPKLTVPTLLVHSRGDVAVPRAVADHLRSHIRDSDLVWIEADGHLPHLTVPRQLHEAIRDRIV